MFELIPFRRKNSGLVKNPASVFDMDSVFENFFNDALWPSLHVSSGQMKVDVREKETEYIIEAELPGVKKEDISIDLNDDLLTITVQKEDVVDEKTERYIRKERRSGAISRSFSIGDVDEENVKATYNNGLLILHLPKRKLDTKKGRKIDIN